MQMIIKTSIHPLFKCCRMISYSFQLFNLCAMSECINLQLSVHYWVAAMPKPHCHLLLLPCIVLHCPLYYVILNCHCRSYCCSCCCCDCCCLCPNSHAHCNSVWDRWQCGHDKFSQRVRDRGSNTTNEETHTHTLTHAEFVCTLY